jgi:eukaryotic-like serine/threonine-protein kinase
MRMAEQEQSAEKLFGAALDLPPESRAAFLDQACRDTPEIRRLVEELLLNNDRLGSFLGKPAFGQPNEAPSSGFDSLEQTTLPENSERFQPGQIIAGRFLVVRFLARGGMGEVYEVRDQFLQGDRVALKLIRPEIAADSSNLRRFEREVILARKVVHPNLCPIYEIFRCQDPAPPFLFLTMKLLQGPTLEAWLGIARSHPVNPEAVEIARQLISGVSALHAAGIIHRDLKPNNIMLERAGDRLNVSIMDFGLARLHQAETTTMSAGMIAGTPGYMAPELFRGEPPSEATDIFALGVVLHQVFTGERPASSKTGALAAAPALRSGPAAGSMTRAVESLLSLDSEERRRAFAGLAQINAGSGQTAPANQNFRKRAPWFVAAGICAVAGLIALAFYFFRHDHPAVVQYTQLTDFTDSATAPALSPDGRMVAFIRGSTNFLSADQVYVKMLPNGEARQLTEDSRLKYGLAFSPDGSKIAYTAVLPPWSTYTVSVLGGDPQLLLSNAAGLTWLDPGQVLFSRVRSGLHMGIVTETLANEQIRDLYFPAHERAMAHYSYASPDRKSALVVEMDGTAHFTDCRLISLAGGGQSRPIGPAGACTSAGWSPDNAWMYFAATVDGRSHLWRQRFPNGEPEQITSGPTEEEGLAVARDGRSLITSMGVHESAIWIHDSGGERSLSSEGEVVDEGAPPTFSADDNTLYYLMWHQATGAGAGPELWRMMVDSGKSEAVFPGVSMVSYNVSPDGKEVVYAASVPNGKSQLWLAPMDRSSPARQIGFPGDTSPHFGARGKILFQFTEGNANYLGQMNQDGSGRSKVVPYPIDSLQSTSPGGRWIMASVPLPEGKGVVLEAIPVEGGPAQVVCRRRCDPFWSSSGEFLFLVVEEPSRTSPGRSLAIPLGAGETLPKFPPEGIVASGDGRIVPGSQSVNRAYLVPGKSPSHFAYVNTTVDRNLYQISIP